MSGKPPTNSRGRFGYYECRVTQTPVAEDRIVETLVSLPSGLFRNVMKTKLETDANGKPKFPLLSIFVKCDTSGMFARFYRD